MKIISILFLFSALALPQNYIFESAIGNFENASSFHINPTGNIFISDTGRDEIYLIDTLGNFIYSIGGYGWEESAFDAPVDIFADDLKIYVSDKNNHRVQGFDKNLNFIFQISTRESEIEPERFGYPLSAVVSNLGDIFILDTENSRIIKFNLFGKFDQNFAGYDYGSYSLVKPKQLAVSMQNNIYVIDGSKIIIFDSYGNGISRIETGKELKSIRIIFNWLTVTTENNIYTANLRLPAFKLEGVNLDEFDEELNITSALVYNNKLYILTRKEILIFSRI